ncbi:helix-turn-helix domain-containing protein [Streptomyces sp. SS]|uniref:helix-turn-helix domain-containing protein n=1 Tax=Streptomyces sp. SS TaxID=260742 RepID=UPI0002DF85C0|nr:XRE family transcriptional regulator [Streptomyces sp. SS]
MPRWKALPDELDPDIRAFTERLRRLVDRSGLGVAAVAERTGHERSAWDTYLSARLPVPRGAVVTFAELTGSDAGSLAADWERAEHAWSRAGRPPLPALPDADADAEAASETGSNSGSGSNSGFDAASETDSETGSGGDRTLQIRRLDRVPTPGGAPAPAPAKAPAPAPPPVSSAPRSRRSVVLLYAAGIIGALLVVTAALLLVDLGGAGGTDGPTAAPPVTATPSAAPRTSLLAGVECAGADCTGQDPEAMGCGGPLAETVARVRVGAALVEVRHSGTCAAVWARITGAEPGDAVTVEAAGAVERVVLPEGADTDAYTPMLAVASAADARACGTLVDGRVGCTVNP